MNKARICFFSQLLFNITWEVLANALRKRQEIKGVQTEKEETILIIFVHRCVIIYAENLKASTKNLLELIITANLQNIRSTYKSELPIYQQQTNGT